jgi:hypothetical protein
MYSRVTYSGDGANQLFSVPFPYLSKDHVEVRIGGTLLTSGYTWSSSSAISISPAPVAGVDNVDVRRHTPRVDPSVSYSDGSTLTAGDLNEAETQLLYIAHEALDDAGSALGPAFSGAFDALGKLITNVGAPTSPTDATPRAYVDQSQVAAAASAAAAHTSATSALASQVAAAGYSASANASSAAASQSASNAASSASAAAASATQAAVDVNAVIATAIAPLAPKASPTFTGTPIVPTAAVNTNTDQAASTKFVLAQASGTNPLASGTAAPGTATKFAREDHVHPAPRIGEFFTASATAVSLTSGAMANVTSISLTAGDWDVSGVVEFNPAGTTGIAYMYAGISTVSAGLGSAWLLRRYQGNPSGWQRVNHSYTSSPAIVSCHHYRLPNRQPSVLHQHVHRQRCHQGSAFSPVTLLSALIGSLLGPSPSKNVRLPY